jgi:hypothetical protein
MTALYNAGFGFLVARNPLRSAWRAHDGPIEGRPSVLSRIACAQRLDSGMTVPTLGLVLFGTGSTESRDRHAALKGKPRTDPEHRTVASGSGHNGKVTVLRPQKQLA